MYGIILVIVLVVMGGAIAFIGDRLGTKVGKKKLSIFGLRPRHTSILVTIVTGFLITAVTLGVVTLASENVRIALFGMEELNAQIRDTEQNLAAVSQELSVMQAERQQNELELQRAREELTKAEAAFMKAQAEVEQIEQDLQLSQAQIDELTAVRDALETQRSQLEEKVAVLNEKQQSLERDVEKYTELAQRLNAGLHFIREGDIVYRAGELVVSSVKKPAAERAANEKYMNALLAGANHQILVRLGIKEPVEALWISSEEVNRSIDELSEVSQDMIVRIVSAGNIVAGEPVRVNVELYQNNLVYDDGQLVYEQVVEVGDNNEEMLMHYLKQVNMLAASRGIIPDPLRGTVGVMGGEQFYEIIHELDEYHKKVRIAAYADGATYTAGPLRLHIKVSKVQ